jgi:hypothetical protein
MKILLFILMLGFISCNSSDKKSPEILENNKEEITKATKQDLINFTNDALAGQLSDTAMFLKYFARPELIINDSIAFYELQYSFRQIEWMRNEYPDDSLLILFGDEMKGTEYELYHANYSKDTFCDNCAVVMLKPTTEQRVTFCYKDEGIFSTRSYMDWDNWEVNWY